MRDLNGGGVGQVVWVETVSSQFRVTVRVRVREALWGEVKG